MTATLYTRGDCPYCESARAALRECGEPYEEIDVTSSRRAEAELRERVGDIIVPVLVEDDGEVRVGFGCA